ncbi:unnamed protein product [Lampetra planeri]
MLNDTTHGYARQDAATRACASSRNVLARDDAGRPPVCGAHGRRRTAPRAPSWLLRRAVPDRSSAAASTRGLPDPPRGLTYALRRDPVTG